ncbi:MAG TPA: ABC transporter ATP-binding protein [Acidimicrobiales bacterium]|nr:ABC transporter ATP-binding protein [Acidimicrobiales bacterium]
MLTASTAHHASAVTVPAEHAPLELLDVHAGYGRIDVLHGVSVAVPRGGVAALLGPNGAGKSTTLGVMSGLIRPSRGCRHVQGRHVNGADADELARIGICHVREGRSVFPNLSVLDNLRVASSVGTPMERLTEVAFSLFPRLEERQKQLAGTLSGGERQMLALARGLGTDPAVLLVDELSMGLAPIIVGHLYEAVAQIAATGVSVLVVEQFATIGMRHASSVYVMARGRVTYAGPPDDAMDAVHAAYLGGQA